MGDAELEFAPMAIALRSLVRDLLVLAYQDHPNEMDRHLKFERILVQSMEAERVPAEFQPSLADHQERLQILEEALGRSNPQPHQTV